MTLLVGPLAALFGVLSLLALVRTRASARRSIYARQRSELEKRAHDRRSRALARLKEAEAVGSAESHAWDASPLPSLAAAPALAKASSAGATLESAAGAPETAPLGGDSEIGARPDAAVGEPAAAPDGQTALRVAWEEMVAPAPLPAAFAPSPPSEAEKEHREVASEVAPAAGESPALGPAERPTPEEPPAALEAKPDSAPAWLVSPEASGEVVAPAAGAPSVPPPTDEDVREPVPAPAYARLAPGAPAPVPAAARGGASPASAWSVVDQATGTMTPMRPGEPLPQFPAAEASPAVLAPDEVREGRAQSAVGYLGIVLALVSTLLGIIVMFANSR